MSRIPDVWLITGVPGAGKTTVSRLLSPLTLGVVVLAYDPAIAIARDLARAEKKVAEQSIWLADVIRAELRDVGFWVDSDSLTPEKRSGRYLRTP